MATTYGRLPILTILVSKRQSISKLRAAVEEGTPVLPLSLAKPGLSALLAPVVIVEGNSDAEIIRALIRIRDTQSSPTIVSAGGRRNLPLVALAQLSLLPGTKNVIIVADGDGKATEIKQQIEQTFSVAVVPLDVNFTIIVIDPDLETALDLAGESARRRLPLNTRLRILQALDLDKLAAANVDFAQLLRSLGLLDEHDRRDREECVNGRRKLTPCRHLKIDPLPVV
jgi:5S rRNA maturation endonuclease (ribonuclease M5)